MTVPTLCEVVAIFKSGSFEDPQKPLTPKNEARESMRFFVVF